MKQIFLCAMACIALLSLPACSKDDVKQEQGPTQSAKVNLKGEATIYGEDSRAITFTVQSDGQTVTIDKQNTVWKTFLFFRKKGSSDMGHIEVTWTPKGSGNNVSLRLDSINATLTGCPAPQVGEEWYVAGIAGGGKLTNDKKGVSFDYDESIDPNLPSNQLRTPYMSSWVKVSIPKTGQLNLSEMKFKPRGALLTMRIHNNMTETANVRQMAITSSAVSNEGFFNFAASTDSEMESAATGTSSTYKIPFKFDYTPSVSTPFDCEYKYEETLPAKSGAEKYGYKLIWVMPKEGANIASGDFLRVSAKPYKLGRKLSDGSIEQTTNRSFVSKALPKDGSKHKANLEIVRYKTPVEYVGNLNVGFTPKTFAINNTPQASGYYTPAAALTASPIGYHLPTVEEWQSVFAPDIYTIVYNNSSFGPKNKIEAITVGLDSFTSTADYKTNINEYTELYGVKFYAVYALKFKKSTIAQDAGFPAQTTNNRIAAYKYEVIKKGETGGKADLYIRVTSVHLGEAGASRTVESLIGDNVVWADSNVDKKVVEFPFCGFILNASPSISPTGGAKEFSATEWKNWVENGTIKGLTAIGGEEEGRYRTATKGTNHYEILSLKAKKMEIRQDDYSNNQYVIRPFTDSLE